MQGRGDTVPTQYLDRTFVYHAPHGDQPERYVALRDTARNFAKMIIEQCPPSRERSVALTKLEEAVMWANASIARNEPPPPPLEPPRRLAEVAASGMIEIPKSALRFLVPGAPNVFKACRHEMWKQVEYPLPMAGDTYDYVVVLVCHGCGSALRVSWSGMSPAPSPFVEVER
jgi:hypothetical protein